MAKINKALDLNKLFSDQEKGKLLKKHIQFPMYAGIKYDGNYAVVIKWSHDDVQFITSGGHTYDHNRVDTIFHHPDIPERVYIVERIGGEGYLGDRVKCNLVGSRGRQYSVGHNYMVHDTISISDYEEGESTIPYHIRRKLCKTLFGDYWVKDMELNSQLSLDEYLKEVVNDGYEGLMLKSPNWYWKDTKSRTVDNVKYKKRPTADLICVGTEEGKGKYEGMIGALVLEDSNGKIVSVGSGLSDFNRGLNPKCFIDRVIEIEYEQILDTYIQPTYIALRMDKKIEEID